MAFLKVAVTRSSSTDLYIEVPDDFNSSHVMMRKNQQILGEIARVTTDDIDWEDIGWEETVEAHSVVRVTEAEAKQYQVGKWPT